MKNKTNPKIEQGREEADPEPELAASASSVIDL
jgi:hypothetical protein